MPKPVVLIVDDEPETRATLSGFLKPRFDCEFYEAGDGEEAVEFIRAHRCDLMLLDIKMPKRSGMSVIIEAKKTNPGLEILVISAWVSDDVADEATKIGANDYIVKPFDLKVVDLKVRNMLEKKGYKVNKI